MEFEVVASSGSARVGSLQLAEGTVQVETPSLLHLTQKGLPATIPPDMLLDLHPDARLCQFTPLHFLESPLSFVIARAGGIHKLSGLASCGMLAVARDMLPKLTHEEEVSEISSDPPTVGPEKYMDVVNACKPDLWASLPDEVPPCVDESRNRLSVDRTLKWLDQCLLLQNAEFGNSCFGVVVGASSIEERIRSAEQTATRNVAGFSLGGFGMGEDVAQRTLLMETVIANLPEEKPRHVCGFVSPEEVLQAIGSGIDLIHSIYPFILTKAGYAMTFPLCMESPQSSPEKQPTVEDVAENGSDSAKINLRSAAFSLDEEQLVAGCKCYTCQRHTRAYVHNLINTQEMLALTLIEMHNTFHFLEFVKEIRESIKKDRFNEFRDWFTSKKHETRVLSCKTEEL